MPFNYLKEGYVSWPVEEAEIRDSCQRERDGLPIFYARYRGNCSVTAFTWHSVTPRLAAKISSKPGEELRLARKSELPQLKQHSLRWRIKADRKTARIYGSDERYRNSPLRNPDYPAILASVSEVMRNPFLYRLWTHIRDRSRSGEKVNGQCPPITEFVFGRDSAADSKTARRSGRKRKQA